jgi:tryptophanase
MSAKKDGIAKIGGFITLRIKTFYDQLSESLILKEGFKPTAGCWKGP